MKIQYVTICVVALAIGVFSCDHFAERFAEWKNILIDKFKPASDSTIEHHTSSAPESPKVSKLKHDANLDKSRPGSKKESISVDLEERHSKKSKHNSKVHLDLKAKPETHSEMPEKESTMEISVLKREKDIHATNVEVSDTSELDLGGHLGTAERDHKTDAHISKMEDDADTTHSQLEQAQPKHKEHTQTSETGEENNSDASTMDDSHPETSESEEETAEQDRGDLETPKPEAGGEIIDLDEDVDTILEVFGKKRGTALTWSHQLATFAALNAAKCHPPDGDKFHLHEDVKDEDEDVAKFLQIGETRYFGSVWSSFENALEDWTSEHKRNKDIHLQILWYKTTHFGCGRAKCPADKVWLAYSFYCEFAPGWKKEEEKRVIMI